MADDVGFHKANDDVENILKH